MNKATQLVCQAEELAKSCTTWADFSNALYDPIEGILAKAFRDRSERAEFVKSPEYGEIPRIMEKVIERHGLIEGAAPKRITEFMVQLHLSASEDSKVQFVQTHDMPTNDRASEISR